MDFFKKLLRSLAFITLGWVLFITPLFYAIYIFTLSPNNLQSALADSGMYSSAVPALIETSISKAETEQAKALLEDPTIQKIANDAFGPQFIQTASDTIVTSFFVWLTGETDRPDFVVDLTEQRTQIIEGLNNYARDRINSLPVCTPAQTLELRQASTTPDLLEITCVPIGANTEQLIADFGQNTVDESNIIEHSTIGLSNITDLERFDDPDIRSIPERFQSQKTAVISLVVIAGMLITTLLIFAADRIVVVRQIGRTFIIIATTLAITIYGTTALFRRSNSASVINASDAFRNDVVDAAVSITKSITQQATRWMIVYAAIGLALYFLARYLRKRTTAKPQTKM